MSGTSPHHNANPRPTNGLIFTKEFSLFRLIGRSGAAASRVTWGTQPRKGRLLSSLVALTAAFAVAAPAANAGIYTVRGTTGWTADADSNGTGFVSTWGDSTTIVGQFSLPRTGFGQGEMVSMGYYTTAMNLVGASFVSTQSGMTGGPWVSFARADGVGIGAEVPTYNHGPQPYGYSFGPSYALSVELGCGGPGDCFGSNAELRVSDLQLAFQDNSNPNVTNATGPLVSTTTLQGSVDINVSATDASSGVYRGWIEVDGVNRGYFPMDPSNASCTAIAAGYVFAKELPCSASAIRTLSLNTTALSDGAHTVEVFVEDASGNKKRAFGPVSRTIDNVPPPINTSDPLITGLLRHGQTLATDTGTWTGTGITFARQWQRYDTGSGTWLNIAGATGPTYAVQTDDYGKKLRTRVRATNVEGTTDAYSEPVGPIASPTDPKGDFDGDGIVNEDDPDDDNDGVPDDGDANPHDPSVGLPPGQGGPGVPAPDDGFNGGGGGTGNNNGGGGSGGGAGSGTGIRIETQNGEGPVATAALAASFEGTKSKTIKVKWGAKRKITGTLLGRDRQPIKGAKLDVHETPQLMGATAIARGQVVTDAKGRFSYQLPAGVSRTIRIAYKSILEASTYAQSTDVTVQVTPKVTMKANRKALRNKQAVTFKGKIAGAPAGVRKIVEFQALDGKKWRTFASTRVAKKGGTFKYRYRFTRTTRTTKYQFRAIIRAEKGWPFATGQTKPINVKVRP
ncbi:hypothetical protein C8N24_0296 [Solirubrobacter pauli]|uniref:Carboxypeptidase family protein n=1 Tax=Solirubrobacter pauli TaxID=166793 RepID=A0A660LCS6_9ACTN|nr:hypothetical protein [Solirubrobacter pauli]RKQ90491.1 hypothetical protein C8N24_0296 [Solirubrobacter pauli]